MLAEKIRSSFGRNLSVTSLWSRLVFDRLLKHTSPFDVDEAIALMTLKCEGKMETRKLLKFGNILGSEDSVVTPLIQKGYLQSQQGLLALTQRGEDALAQIWELYDEAEMSVLEGFDEKEKEFFKNCLNRLQANCQKILPLHHQ